MFLVRWLFVALLCGFVISFGIVAAVPVKKPMLRGVTVLDWGQRMYYDKNGTLTGYFVDLMDKISEKAGFNYQLYAGTVTNGTFRTEQSEDAMIGEVKRKYADFAVFDLEITAERKRSVDFTIPHLVDPFVILIPKENAKNITTFEQLIRYNQMAPPSEQISIGMEPNGTIYKTLSTTNDAIGKNLFENTSRNKGINFIKFPPFTQAWIRLLSNSKFGLLMSSHYAQHFTKEKQSDCFFTTVRDTRKLSKFNFQYGIALQKGSKWLEPFNRAIRELHRDGTIQALRKQYFPGNCIRKLYSKDAVQ